MRWHRSRRIPCDPSQVGGVVQDIVDDLRQDCSAQDCLAITVSLVEMIMNAIEHGNLAIGSQCKHQALETGVFDALVETRRRQQPYASRQVRIDCDLEPRRVVLTISDEGVGFDWRGAVAPAGADQPVMPHGRGILIARTYMDECVFHPPGNVVTLVKYW